MTTNASYKPSKILLASVIIMGILIIIGTTLLLAIIFQRMSHHSTAADETTTAPISFSQKLLPVDKDEHIKQIAPFGNHNLAFLVSHDNHERIILWDLSTNKIMGTLDTIDPR